MNCSFPPSCKPLVTHHSLSLWRRSLWAGTTKIVALWTDEEERPFHLRRNEMESERHSFHSGTIPSMDGLVFETKN